ncbi:MAG: diacylglycerol kinase family enzyme, partial [Verrucomicrobiales bacterium]
MSSASESLSSSLVVLNQGAGTVVGSSISRVIEQVVSGFKRAGIEPPEIKACAPHKIEAALREAARSGIERVFVGGGDGTVATAATIFRGTTTALGVLPMGTFNLVARDLSIPLELEEAATALALGEVDAIDVASVNGQTYLCVCVLGFYPNIAFKRKEYRGLPWWRKAIGIAYAMLRSFHDYPALLVTAVIDGEQTKFKSRFVAVSNNAYVDEPGLIPTKDGLAEGELGLYVSDHRTTLQLLHGSLAFIGGSITGDPCLKLHRCGYLMIDAKRKLRVMLDGEILRLPAPLAFESHPQSLRVIRPSGEG